MSNSTDLVSNLSLSVLSLMAGLLAALGLSLSVRLETGYPPGNPSRPFAKFLNEQAPKFATTDLDGNPVSISQISAEKHIRLIYFMNPLCGGCKQISPLIQELDSRLPMLIVGLGSRNKLDEKRRELQLNSPIVHDSLKTITKLYEVSRLPSLVLIGSGGFVLGGADGAFGVERFIEDELSSFLLATGIETNLANSAEVALRANSY